MKKRMVSVMLTAVMTAGLLAGCGGSSASETEAAASASAAEETAAASEAAAEEAGDAAEGGIAAGHTYAIITKSAGNPYNEREASGFKEVIEANGGTCIIQQPETATADAQISVINSLISQGVDSICLAANDENALQATLQQAMDAGIKVSCLDSKVNPDSRATFVNQAGTMEIGQALVDAVYDLAGGEG